MYKSDEGHQNTFLEQTEQNSDPPIYYVKLASERSWVTVPGAMTAGVHMVILFLTESLHWLHGFVC